MRRWGVSRRPGAQRDLHKGEGGAGSSETCRWGLAGSGEQPCYAPTYCAALPVCQLIIIEIGQVQLGLGFARWRPHDSTNPRPYQPSQATSDPLPQSYVRGRTRSWRKAARCRCDVVCGSSKVAPTSVYIRASFALCAFAWLNPMALEDRQAEVGKSNHWLYQPKIPSACSNRPLQHLCVGRYVRYTYIILPSSQIRSLLLDFLHTVVAAIADLHACPKRTCIPRNLKVPKNPDDTLICISILVVLYKHCQLVWSSAHAVASQCQPRPHQPGALVQFDM